VFSHIGKHISIWMLLTMVVELFSHIGKHISIWMLLAMVVELNLELKQKNDKFIFLYVDSDETTCMKQLEWFEVGHKKGYVCKLKYPCMV